MANVCCSIEMEPKTLNEGQLNYAREVAADVVQKMEPKDASIIFIKGKESIGAIEENKKTIEKGDQLSKIVDCNYADEKTTAQNQPIEIPCQCSFIDIVNMVDSPDQIHLKEPLSAPF